MMQSLFSMNFIITTVFCWLTSFWENIKLPVVVGGNGVLFHQAHLWMMHITAIHKLYNLHKQCLQQLILELMSFLNSVIRRNSACYDETSLWWIWISCSLTDPLKVTVFTFFGSIMVSCFWLITWYFDLCFAFSKLFATIHHPSDIQSSIFWNCVLLKTVVPWVLTCCYFELEL